MLAPESGDALKRHVAGAGFVLRFAMGSGNGASIEHLF